MHQLNILLENTPQQNFKLLLKNNKIDLKTAKEIKDIDPHPKKAFSFWMALQWISKQVTDKDELRNNMEEFYSFFSKGQTTIKDINEFKTFSQLKDEVTKLNNSASAVSNSDLESDYDTIVDDDNLLIMVPHTHESSRKLGLSHFKYRDCEDGLKDSSWCTTYKAPNHFNDYYYKNNVTFYYIKVKSQQLIEKLEAEGYGPEFVVVAIAIYSDEDSQKLSDAGHSRREAYDATDKQFKDFKLDNYLEIIGVE
jgi:hypothetical protein